MTASVSSTGTETVTGAHSSSAVAEPSTTAFRAKIRQNNDSNTGRRLSVVPLHLHCPPVTVTAPVPEACPHRKPARRRSARRWGTTPISGPARHP
ncbi:hypothetical protein GCM10020256_12750 [Streptomyces thermocoprophilus]